MRSPFAAHPRNELEQVLRTATFAGDEIAGLMATMGLLLNRSRERLDSLRFPGTALSGGESLQLVWDACQLQSVAMGLGTIVIDLIRVTRVELSDVMNRSPSTGTVANSAPVAAACKCTMQLLSTVESTLQTLAEQVQQDTVALRESVARIEAQGDACALANKIIARAQRHRN